MFPTDQHSWFLKPYSCDRPDIVTDAAFELIAESGTPALTMRAIAARTRMSPSWLTDRFTNRARMLAIIAGVFGGRLIGWVQARLGASGLLALLPEDDEEVVAIRVWLALVELGRIEQPVSGRISDVRDFERAVVAHRLECGVRAIEVDERLALVDGLRTAIADPERPMRPSRARHILSQR